jgi:small subunit ribosomal protein S3
MLYEDKLIEEYYSRYRIMKYLERRLERAGLASIDIQRTPMVTRITLEVTNPAKIIGRGGRLINELTSDIKNEFKIDNPQVSVIDVREPFLEPRMVAKRAAKYIEMGKKVRAVLHYMLREILRAGALGAEIISAGKIGAKGARAKRLRVSAGYIPKAGEPARLVREAHLNANTKSGVIGVFVRIVPPGTVFPDKKTEEIAIPKVVEAAGPVGRPRREDAGAGSKPSDRGGGGRNDRGRGGFRPRRR